MPTDPRQFDDDYRHANYLRHGYRCAYTGQIDKTFTGKGLSLDHIIPIHLGGELQNKRGDSGTNLTTAGLKVNSAKGKMTKEQWSAYAANRAPPKSGLKFSWPEIEKGSQPPPELDLVRGAQLSKLAAQARGARRLDRNGKRTIETPKSRAIAEKSRAIVESYQAEQAAKAKETPTPKEASPAHVGPGIHHGSDGRFESARLGVTLAARDLVRHLRARHAGPA